MRKEGKNEKKHEGRRKFKGGKRNKRDKDRAPRDPASRKERLDKEMERYWVKGGHKELGKCRNR